MYTITLPAKTENLDHVIEFVEEHLEEYEVPMPSVIKLDIAVEEIFVNIASYAYPDREDGTATIQLEVTEEPQKVRVRFIDSGYPYDPLKKPDPDITLTADERAEGGLGVFMVKKSMSEMYYTFEEGKNILTIELKTGV